MTQPTREQHEELRRLCKERNKAARYGYCHRYKEITNTLADTVPILLDELGIKGHWTSEPVQEAGEYYWTRQLRLGGPWLVPTRCPFEAGDKLGHLERRWSKPVQLPEPPTS